MSSACLNCLSWLQAVAILLLIILTIRNSEAQLSTSFYDESCPLALPTIRAVVRRAVADEPRMAASLLRLLFHDCFVQGCDASILLDDSPTIQSEKNVFPNRGSVRGFEVMDAAKSAVEKVCPGVVSCADILAVAARDATVSVGGPYWNLELGRRDSITANQSLVQMNLPREFNELSTIVHQFARQGLNVRDMVALSGSHTIGMAHCIFFQERIYNETNIDPGFAKHLKYGCPKTNNRTELLKLAPLDLRTPNYFDNYYYKDLMEKKGVLHSDQALFSGSFTDELVSLYSRDMEVFFIDFAAAMVKMGGINVLTGSAGEVRKVCRAINYIYG